MLNSVLNFLRFMMVNIISAMLLPEAAITVNVHITIDASKSVLEFLSRKPGITWRYHYRYRYSTTSPWLLAPPSPFFPLRFPNSTFFCWVLMKLLESQTLVDSSDLRSEILLVNYEKLVFRTKAPYKTVIIKLWYLWRGYFVILPLYLDHPQSH